MSMDAGLRHTLLDYLAAHHTLTLATAGADGPAAAALYYASDEQFRLYVLSDAHSRHAANLLAQSAVALAIHEDYTDWRQIQGIQMRGQAQPAGRETAEALRHYLGKFAFLRAFIDDPRRAGELLTQKWGKSQFFIITPHWLRWIDNRVRFGQRREYDFITDQELTHE